MLDSDEERSLFAERYDQFYESSLYLAKTLLQDEINAEDAVHEAFIDVIKRRKKFLYIPYNDFRRVFAVIVRYKCIDILRREKRTANAVESGEVFSDIEYNIEEQAIRLISIQEMSQHLNEVDEISRQVLYMKYIMGMSYKAIGEKLNMTVKNVEVRIARAKKKVRDRINEGDSDAG
jgi:RNA polymerase sigma-70 factor (ECF subfamily)